MYSNIIVDIMHDLSFNIDIHVMFIATGTGGSLFGSTSTQPAFGSFGTSQQPSTGLFGSSTNTGTTGLFGSGTTTGSLFGQPTTSSTYTIYQNITVLFMRCCLHISWDVIFDKVNYHSKISYKHTTFRRRQ